MNTKALWITGIAVIVIIVLILKGGVAPRVQPTPTDQTGVPTGKLPAGSQAPGDPKDLVGTWVWQKTSQDYGELVTPKNPGVFTITFKPNGEVGGTTDCNGFGGEYKVGSDGVISMGPFISTQMYCEGAQESTYMNELGYVQRYELRQTGELVLVFRKDWDGGIYFTKK